MRDIETQTQNNENIEKKREKIRRKITTSKKWNP